MAGEMAGRSGPETQALSSSPWMESRLWASWRGGVGVTGHKCWQALDRVPLAQPGRVDYTLKLKTGLAAASALGREEKQADGGGIGLGLGGGQRCPESRGLALGTGRQKVRFAPGQRSHIGA